MDEGGTICAAARKPARRPPLRSDSKAKKEKIVAAAIALLETHSLPALTMNMIASAAGITRTSIYDFFPTVFAVHEEVARRHIMHSWYFIRGEIEKSAPGGLEPLIDACVDGATLYFNGHGAARKTLCAAGALELHVLDHDFDILAARMYRTFHAPDWPIEPYSEEDPYRSIALIQNSLYTASVRRWDAITPFMADQAKLASKSYIAGRIADWGWAALESSPSSLGEGDRP